MNRETGLCTGTLDGDNTIASFDFLAKLFTDGYADATCDYEDLSRRVRMPSALYGHSKYQDYKAALGDDLIQSLIEKFPISFPQRDSYIEQQDSLHIRLQAIVKKPLDIFPGIINKRKNGSHPHKGGIPNSLHFISTSKRSLVVETLGSIFRHKSSS